MSAQRYHPADQRYAPQDDSRFPPRDRSPPRYTGDRFASSSTYRPGYQDRPDEPRDSTAVNRDVPRGPKAAFDAPRGTAPFSPAPPRGRGYSGRGDYRGASRAADAPRDSRDPPSWTEDRDRSWADRDLDRRDRRLSSPGRARPPDFRDFREPAPPPSRDYDLNRGRAGPRDQPLAASSVYEPRRESFSSRGRGYLTRGRGRGDWDARGREREGFPDERPARSRSRSPIRNFRTDREPPRNRDNFEPRDERRFDGREDRPLDKSDRERNFERYNRERSPFRNDSRRPSVSSTAASSPRPLSPALTQQSNAARPFNDQARPLSALRRVSVSTDRWEDRRENLAAETQDARERPHSRTSSPPPPIQVPAFGWNVWKAPTEPKAMKQNALPASTATASVVPPNAPTGPKLAPPSSVIAKPISEKQPPTGPKGDHPAPPLRTPANVHSQRLNRVQTQSGVTSPPASPTLIAPSGPRAAATPGTSPALGANIPTGPKIDRSQPQPPPWVPTAPTPSAARQWQRPSGPGLSGKTGPLIPAKRDFSGDERMRDSSEQSAQTSAKQSDSQKAEETMPGQFPSSEQHSRRTMSRDANEINIKQPRSPAWGDEFESSTVAEGPIIASNRLGHDEGDDLMELDEDDFEKKEERFQREKARLESELVDLSSHELRGSYALEQIALLSNISLSAFSSRNTPPGPLMNDEQAVFGTGHLLTPKAEGLSQNGIAPRKRLTQTEPAPIGSPEIQTLPFLQRGPPTPLEELDVYKQNAARYRQAGPDLENVLKERFAAKQEEERLREDKYGELYRPWMSLVEQVDKEPKEETPFEEEPVPSPSVPLLDTPALSTSATEGRRRGGVSEYDIERVLQESLETANRENARRMKLELSAKIDHDKEAIENAQKDVYIRDEHDFIDKNRQISVAKAVSHWNFEPPVDNVSQQDHELLVKIFRDYPKKWGKIAQIIEEEGGGRLTYKDCINHYYATKWSQEYKERRDKRRQRGGKGGRLRGAQGRPKANALISNLGDIRADLYDGDDFGAGNLAVTDSGRPRRAAAPTFGEKEAEEQVQSIAPTPGRRGPKGNETLNGSNEKPARRSRGSTRERGGRKPRGQPSMRTRSTSPEKMDVDISKRTLVDARLPNGTQTGEFNIADALASAGSGIAPHPSSSSRGVVSDASHPAQGAALPIDGNNTSASQPRSGPSSYWSVQEVSAFPAYLAHYGTDWHAIAQKMDTKTGTMVKNYYFRLISNNNRPDLEELVRKADQKRQRGEQAGLIDPPALQTKKRGEGNQPSAPRPLAPSAETMETMDGPPSYRTTSSAQQILSESRRRQSYSPVSQRPLVHGMSGQSADIGRNGTEQNLIQARRNEQASAQSLTAQHQGLTSHPSRNMLDYEPQARQGPPQNLQHHAGRQFSEVSLPPGQQPLTSSSSRYYQGSPQPHMAQLSMNVGGHRTALGDIKGVDERQYSHPMDPPTHRPSYVGQPGIRRQSPPQGYGEQRRSRPTSPVPDPNRFAGPSSQVANQPPAAARPEPRKKSNLLDILNNDEPPKRSSNPPSHLRTATPPPSQYPQRPSSSHPDRTTQYSEPERSTTYPRPSFSQQNSAPARTQSEIGPREPQSSNQNLGRQDWQSQPTFAPLSGSSQQQGYRPHLLDRAPPATSVSMEYHRTSLQSLTQRHVASPPPSLGFSHPSQHAPQARQQSHRRPSPPSHSLQPNSYAPNQGQTPSAMQQNQQAYQRNSSIGMAPQQQSMPQRQSTYESLGGRSEAEFRPRHDISSRPKDEDVHIARERESQTRSNIRPDSFLTREYRNPFKQGVQHRQADLEQRRQYGPVQDEHKRPLSPRLSQAYPGRGPEQQQQPPPSGRG